MKMIKKSLIINLYLLIYGLLSAWTLVIFPFVHSDEPWLSGLSQAYLTQRSPFVTEPFFDLVPRQAHALKSFFHILQAVFISLLGDHVFTVRLISLLAGLCILYLFYRQMTHILKNPLHSVLLTALLSLNLQFVYASHFARQEILLALFLLLVLRVLCDFREKPYRCILLAGCLAGLSIGFHPNAFIIAAMIGSALFYEVLTKRFPVKALLLFIGLLGLFALVFLGASLIGNPDFFKDYWTFGQTFSVDAPPAARFTNFAHFYIKLYDQISGTYYLPDMRVFFAVSLFVCFAGAVVYVFPWVSALITKGRSILHNMPFKRHRRPRAGDVQRCKRSESLFSKFSGSELRKPSVEKWAFTDKKYKKKKAVLFEESRHQIGFWLFMLIGYQAALFVIGRFNPTSILFILFPLFFLLANLLNLMSAARPTPSSDNSPAASSAVLSTASSDDSSVASPAASSAVLSTASSDDSSVASPAASSAPLLTTSAGISSAALQAPSLAISAATSPPPSAITARIVTLLLCMLLLFTAYQAFSEISRHSNDDYAIYISEISGALPADAVVLGNLNSRYAMQNRPFYDIRNLYALGSLSVEMYMRERGINTLIWYEADDYIHRNPEWKILYGDDRAFYDDVQTLIRKNGTLLYAFESPVYGNRIVRYMYDYPWKVWIYHIALPVTQREQGKEETNKGDKGNKGSGGKK